MTTSITLTTQSTLLDVLENYFIYLNNQGKGNEEERQIKSIIIRFIVPGFGGSKPKGKRATSKEVVDALAFLKHFEPLEVARFPKIVEEEFTKAKLDKDNQRAYRSHIKKFVDWAEKSGYCQKVKSKQEVQPRRLHASAGEARRDWHGSLTMYDRPMKKPYRLGSKSYPNDYLNPELLKELEEFSEFIIDKLQLANKTKEKEVTKALQFLGWLHRYKEVSLDDLRLSSIIHFYPHTVKIEDFDDHINYLVQKERAKNIAFDKARENKKLIDEYIKFVGGHPSSRVFALSACITLAKFIYKEEVGGIDFPDFNSIFIIASLNKESSQLSKEAKKTPPTIRKEEQVCSWDKLVMVMENCRQRAEQRLQECTTKRNGIQIRQRTDYALHQDYQEFLSIAFMTLIPPLRASTYCQLEIGKTLVQGIFDGPQFIPVEKMIDRSSAVWYIRLDPKQYKTGKTHGEYMIPILNFQWADGSTFYKYIEDWVMYLRKSLYPIDHNFFFFRPKESSHSPLVTKDWGPRIKYAVDRVVKIRVPPNMFRHSYVTFTQNREVEDEVKNFMALIDDRLNHSTASVMQHTPLTRSNYYDLTTFIQKVMPALKYIQVIARKVLAGKPV
jgi:hypothetical protein